MKHDLEMSVVSFERSIDVRPTRIQQIIKKKSPVDHRIIEKKMCKSTLNTLLII